MLRQIPLETKASTRLSAIEETHYQHAIPKSHQTKMLNTKCHKTLTKTLVNRSSPSNQGSYQLDFPNFSPLRSGLTTCEHTEMVWEGKDRTPHPSERKPHKSIEQGHLAWEKPQRPTQCLGPQRHGQRLDTTETRMHDPSRRGTKGSTPIMDKQNHTIPQEEAQKGSTPIMW